MKQILYQMADSIGKLVQRQGPVILVYHDISNKSYEYSVSIRQFAGHMKALANETQFLSLDDVVSAHETKTSLHGVVITFDDGYCSIMDTQPILDRYQIPAAVFVLSDQKHVDRARLNNTLPLLSTNEIIMLAKKGWTIGVHGATHTDLSAASLDTIYNEISRSKRTLEKVLNRQLSYYAYPHGYASTDIIQAVKYADYRAAFGVEESVVSPTKSTYFLPRILIDKGYQAEELVHRVSPGVQMVRHVIHGNPWRIAV